MDRADWKAEMASHEVGDPSIENSGNNLKIVEVDYRKNSGDDNTYVYFYRTKEDAQATRLSTQPNQTADWYYKDDNEDGAECHAMSGTPKQFADAAVGRGATNLETTGDDHLGEDVVISYALKDKSYSYSFYKSHEKCANPLNAADNTRSDFSRIGHDVDDDQDKADQTLADEALKHATDKGPWWVSDGTKIWAGCKLSKFTPMGDALSAKAKGARNIEIEGGLRSSNVSHPIDVVVQYDLNGKSFFNDYYTNKFCDDVTHRHRLTKLRRLVSHHVMVKAGMWITLPTRCSAWRQNDPQRNSLTRPRGMAPLISNSLCHRVILRKPFFIFSMALATKVTLLVFTRDTTPALMTINN